MDDMALIHSDTEELQHMLNITNETAKRYHIKFGTEKKPNFNTWQNETTTQTRGRPTTTTILPQDINKGKHRN